MVSGSLGGAERSCRVSVWAGFKLTCLSCRRGILVDVEQCCLALWCMWCIAARLDRGSAWRPLKATPGQDVKMQMRDLLSGRASTVADDPVALV